MRKLKCMGALIALSSVWSANAACHAANGTGVSEAKARALAEQVTHTAKKGSYVYPEMDRSSSPGFYQFELHWDREVEGDPIAAFLLIDKKTGTVFEVMGVTCSIYGHDKKMRRIHPGGSLNVPDVCE
jgi:hypothetical protein